MHNENYGILIYYMGIPLWKLQRNKIITLESIQMYKKTVQCSYTPNKLGMTLRGVKKKKHFKHV